MRSLIQDVEHLWNSEKKFFEQKIAAWINDVNKKKDDVKKARKAFHQWEPLRVYTSVTKLKGSPPSFSLRFLGQEVAEIRVYKNGEVKLAVTKQHVKWNKNYFNLNFNRNGFIVDWNSNSAKQFRDQFKLKQKQKVNTHSLEHQIESEIINSMRKSSKNTFLTNIQPVLVADCPLQIPVPIKGASGIPEKSVRGGNIDILARRGFGKNALVSVWELKRPGLTNRELIKATRQSIIYASTIALVLRSASGQEWYNLFGFNSNIPKKLRIEAILTIATRDKPSFDVAIKKIPTNSKLFIQNDIIVPYVAYYDDYTYKIKKIDPIE